MLRQPPLEMADPIKSKTTVGRVELFTDQMQPIGRAFNAIRDAVTRGWREQMHFVDYDSLTRDPQRALQEIYTFLGEASYEHDFENVEQITFEDDFVYGLKDLHTIRQKVEPQPPRWPKVFDKTVTSEKVWQNVERHAQFWRAYV